MATVPPLIVMPAILPPSGPPKAISEAKSKAVENKTVPKKIMIPPSFRSSIIIPIVVPKENLLRFKPDKPKKPDKPDKEK